MKKKFTLLFGIILSTGIVLYAQKSATIEKISAGTPIVLDGLADESFWSEAEAHDINSLLVKDGLEQATDEYDYSATWKAVWNDTAIIVIVEVTDELLSISTDAAPPALPANAWATDKIENYFHFGNEKIPGINLGQACSEGYWQYAINIGPRFEYGVCHENWDKFFWGYSETDFGYNIEYSIRWDALGLNKTSPFNPEDDASFTFDILVTDNDNLPGDGGIVAVSPRSMYYWSSNNHMWDADANNSWDSYNAGTVTLANSLPNSISNKKLESKVFIYPNPVKNHLHVNGVFETAVVKDISGREVKYFSNVSILDLSDFKSGVYFLMLKNQSFNTTLKFIKE